MYVEARAWASRRKLVQGPAELQVYIYINIITRPQGTGLAALPSCSGLRVRGSGGSDLCLRVSRPIMVISTFRFFDSVVYIVGGVLEVLGYAHHHDQVVGPPGRTNLNPKP